VYCTALHTAASKWVYFNISYVTVFIADLLHIQTYQRAINRNVHAIQKLINKYTDCFYSTKQDRKCTYNVTRSRVRVTTVAVEKQQVLQFNYCLFFTNLDKFFILIHLLHSSTCFEHYCAHHQEDICIGTASGIVTLYGYRLWEDESPLINRVLNSHLKTVTISDAVPVQLPSWR